MTKQKQLDALRKGGRGRNVESRAKAPQSEGMLGVFPAHLGLAEFDSIG
ncbi:MAG: hypothetical protein JWQ04_1053 [Pedosphaera sp.]|nr:hypothetical protein [Pedosphaera sp.]